VTIVVFAATSLTAAFNDIKGAFEAAYPYITVTTSYGASSTLATNINNGAPADVFASADYANINRISMAGGATRVVRNRLEIIVQPGNPKGIATLADLAAPGVLYVTAAPGVPIRTYADQALASAGVTVAPVSFEANVGAIVTKVTSGSADAGIVYRTDVLNAGASALGVVIPDANNVIAEYPAAVPSGSSHQAEANLFINFLLSATGQNLLINRGFIGA
jgi:molybdate transport system substrate-binding protein